MEQKAVENYNRAVQRVQFHTGVQIGTRVKNSLDCVVDKVDMKMCFHGVLIQTETGDEFIVGMPDILWVKLK